MSDNFYTTTTAALKATKADIRWIDAKQIKLNGKPIPSKVFDERGEFVTDQDLWGTTVTTDENGVVHVSHKWVTNPNISEGSAWNSSVKAVQGNKAYSEITTGSTGNFTGIVEDSVIANIQTEMIENGSYMFTYTPLISFYGDLSSLVDGVEMFTNTSLTSFSGGLRSLRDGDYMFSHTPLSYFGGDLSSLVYGESMFDSTSLKSFDGDLSSLIYSGTMFSSTPLTSFNGDLSSLVDGYSMFSASNLTSFNANLKSLKNAMGMFYETSLTSFNIDLSSLINGAFMFSNTHKRGYSFRHYKMVDGVKTQVEEHFRAEGLTSFSGDLGSLQCGLGMFGDGSDVTYENEEGVIETTKNITPLDEQSVMIIADTIKDLNGFSDWDSSFTEDVGGIIHIGYNSEVCDAAKIEEYCTEIMNKGWTVYLNGTVQTTDDGIEGIATLAEDGSITVAPVPYYCKSVEVEQKEANWTDGEKYYIILGAQKVFGDDLSTYGMFTSIENAAMNMGFTPYEYVEEETETVEEN